MSAKIDGIRRDYVNVARRDWYAKQRSKRFRARFGLLLKK